MTLMCTAFLITQKFESQAYVLMQTSCEQNNFWQLFHFIEIIQTAAVLIYYTPLMQSLYTAKIKC